MAYPAPDEMGGENWLRLPRDNQDENGATIWVRMPPRGVS